MRSDVSITDYSCLVEVQLNGQNWYGLNVDRRIKILKAAEQLITHYGVAKTTVGDIASAAKVGVGSVYLEFSSKDAIVAALTASHHDRAFDYVRILDEEPSETVLRRFLEARLARFAELVQKPHGLDLIACACVDARKVKQRYEQTERDALVRFLTRAGAGDPELKARTILELHDSYEHRACQDHETPDTFGAFLDLITGGIF